MSGAEQAAVRRRRTYPWREPRDGDGSYGITACGRTATGCLSSQRPGNALSTLLFHISPDLKVGAAADWDSIGPLIAELGASNSIIAGFLLNFSCRKKIIDRPR